MEKPWRKGYDQGFDDRLLGRKPKVKEITNGPFVNISDMENKQAYDKGYLVGYEDEIKKGKPFFNEGKKNNQKNFQEGYFNGFQDGALGKTPEIKKERKKPLENFLSIDTEAEKSYRKGYLAGYKHGKC